MHDNSTIPNRVIVRKRYAQLLEEYSHDELAMVIERLGDDLFRLSIPGKNPVKGPLRSVLEHIDIRGRMPIMQLFTTQDPELSAEVLRHFGQHSFELLELV